uniref:Fatty acid hydroxylase domain-containing protein n=1 Tax=Cyanoptyche gloeocystis TaxID=77922 RepID=A0A7S2NNJ3_9EUKA
MTKQALSHTDQAWNAFEFKWHEFFSQYHGVWATSLITLAIHEIAYFGCYLPFFIADFIPFFHKWKIQPEKSNQFFLQWRCVKQLFVNHFLIQLPIMLVSHPTMEAIGMTWETPLPTWRTLAWQVVLFFFIEDFYFYWIHRLLHYGAFYKFIHKKHHDHAAPFGIAAEYAHPVETFFLGLGSILGPFLFGRHLLSLWVWLLFRMFQTIECHSGYDFPWSLSRLLPIWGGADFHDYHHMAFVGNYASTFRIWDWVFGTDKKYRQWKASSAPTSKFVPELTGVYAKKSQ